MKRRKTCGEYIADKVAAARDKHVEETFSELERQVVIDRLSKDAAQREREKNEAQQVPVADTE